MLRRGLVFVALGLMGCPAPEGRAPGVRAPMSAACDALDETRCLLPWPSSTFTVVDETSATGVRVAITPSSLPVRESTASLDRLDGFSVATPLAVGFPSAVAPSLETDVTSAAVRLFVAQPGDAFGEEVPVRVHLVADGETPASLVVGWPQRPLRYDTDYVAVVLDDVVPVEGARFETPRRVQLALGLVSPSSDEERAVWRYHAPSRTVLSRAGVEFSRVLRVWDFTTRSAEGHSAPMVAMRARALAAALQVEVASAALRDGGVEVTGQVSGLPRFVSDAGVLVVEPVGQQSVPFRAVLPSGAGLFPLVLFGHGTGSSVSDPDLDDDFLATGAGKLNLEFEGWTRASVGSTFAGLLKPQLGAERAAAGLAQSLVNASALQAALVGVLGEALTAPMVGGVVNPAAGRSVDASRIAWLGSSLGGTMGYAYAQLEPSLRAAVLNVPGAGFSQFMLIAEQWQQLDAVFSITTPSGIDRALAMIAAQGQWDLIDGAAWSAHGRPTKPLLVQESMGDPVLPNVGNELVAASAGAVQVGRVLRPVLGVSVVEQAVEQPALTQFRVPMAETGSGAKHAFLTKDTPAGVAAREQVRAFLSSTWAGRAAVLLPPTCAANGDRGCDFW